MDIGNKIKELRLKKRITQEELAENLEVSPKAISRWENQTTYPDISLLPTIAYYFGITTDELLGVDLYKKDEDIKLILEEVKKYKHSGDMLKLIELLRNGLKKYPNNFILLKELAYALFMLFCSSTDYKDALQECIKICERVIVECQDEKIKNNIISILCECYWCNGDTQKALDLIEKLPSVYSSREYMRSILLRGEEYIEEHQYSVMNLITCISGEINKTFTCDSLKNIELQKKVIELYFIFYDREDVGFNSWNLMMEYLVLAKEYAKIKDYQNTLQAVYEAIECAKYYNSKKGIYKYKSIAFDRVEVDFEKKQTNSTRTIFEQIEDWLGGKNFIDFKQTSEYQEVVKVLEKLK